MPQLQSTITKQLPEWMTYLGIAFLCSLSLLIGGIFGYRLNAGAGEITATPQDIQTAVENGQDNQPQIETIEVEGVFWILPGQEPICPDTHPIKGALQSSGVSYFYAPDSKMYKRVMADICFTTQEFARDVAGFVKKF